MTYPPPPPLPRPKRRNAFLRLYDLPLYQDWAVWLTIFMLFMAPFSLVTGKRQDSDGLPRWADASLGSVVLVLLFGVLPAFARLKYRQHKWRQTNPAGRAAEFQVPTPVPRPVRTAPRDEDDRPAPQPFVAAQPPPSEAAPGTPFLPTDAPRTASRTTRTTAPPIGRSGLRDSTQLKWVRDNLQYPIARSARSVQLAGDSRDEYENILRAGEAIAVTAGVTIAAALRPFASQSPALQALHEAYLDRGVSQGHWQAVLSSARSIVDGLETQPIPNLIEALTVSKKGGLVPALRTLVEERNRWAHSAGPRSSHAYAARVAELAPVLETAMGRLGFLQKAPWVLVESSSYRRATNDFAISATEAMGDHPEFEPQDFVSSRPLADNNFYMLLSDGPVDLSPFVVVHLCPECMQQEICYADRLDDKNGVALKSFSSGHSMFDRGLNDEVRTMFPASAG